MNTAPDESEDELEEEFDPHAERAKSESTVQFAMVEEICGTAIVITVLICITALLLHWT